METDRPKYEVGGKIRMIVDYCTLPAGQLFPILDIDTQDTVQPIRVGLSERTSYWPRVDMFELVPPGEDISLGFVATAVEDIPAGTFVPKYPGKHSNPKDISATNKIPLSLCSPIASAKWAVAQFSGLVKYGAWNWRIVGVRSSVYLDAARRHLDAYVSGEEVDPIDGTDHRANIMACMAILMDAEAAGKLTDDRPPRVGIRFIYEGCEKLMATLREKYAHLSPTHYTIEDTECDS